MVGYSEPGQQGAGQVGASLKGVWELGVELVRRGRPREVGWWAAVKSANSLEGISHVADWVSDQREFG